MASSWIKSGLDHSIFFIYTFAENAITFSMVSVFAFYIGIGEEETTTNNNTSQIWIPLIPRWEF